MFNLMIFLTVFTFFFSFLSKLKFRKTKNVLTFRWNTPLNVTVHLSVCAALPSPQRWVKQFWLLQVFVISIEERDRESVPTNMAKIKDKSFLCLVLVEPKAPCYRAHVCVRNSGFSRILRQQPETTFEQCLFDVRIPRRHDVDGNQQPETTFEQCSFDFRIPRRHDVDAYFLLRSLHVLTLRVCSTTLVSFLCLR